MKSFLFKSYSVRYGIERTSILFPNRTKYVWYLLPSLSVYSCMAQRFLFHAQPAINIRFHFLIFCFSIEIAHVIDPVELARLRGENWLDIRNYK